MEKKAFALLKDIEDSWWFKGRTFAVTRLLSNMDINTGGKVLDIGAGFGSMFPILKKYGEVTAFEIYPEGIEACNSRGYSAVITSSGGLASEKGKYSLIGAFDVLEHIRDDREMLAIFSGLLRPRGKVILTVPAYAFLFSVHDIEHHHFRRYSRSNLTALLREAGFKIDYSGYLYFSLFPLAALLRLFGVSGGESLAPGKFINRAISFLLFLESKCIPFISFPFGTTVIVSATKTM